MKRTEERDRRETLLREPESAPVVALPEGGADLEAYKRRVAARQRVESRSHWRVAIFAALIAALPAMVYGSFGINFYEIHSADQNVHKTVELPDGSSARLAPGARIEYMKRMSRSERREVHIDGAVTFTVSAARAGERYLYAWTDHAFVMAIGADGTRFTVHEEDGLTKVEVHSGRVSISRVDAEGVVRGRQRFAGAGEQVRITSEGAITPVPEAR